MATLTSPSSSGLRGEEKRSRAFCVAKSKGRTWNRKKVAETQLLSRPPLLCHLSCWEHGFLSPKPNSLISQRLAWTYRDG